LSEIFDKKNYEFFKNLSRNRSGTPYTFIVSLDENHAGYSV